MQSKIEPEPRIDLKTFEDRALIVCELIAQGSILKDALSKAKINHQTFWNTRKGNQDINEAYDNALKMRAENKFEELEELISKTETKKLTAAQSKMIYEIRRYMLARDNPKRYGESTQIRHADADGNKLTDILASIDGSTAGLPSTD